MRRLALLLALLAGCPAPVPAPDPAPETAPPFLFARPEHRQPTLDRVDEEPWASLLVGVQERATRPSREPEDPDRWDHGSQGQNGETAFNAAFLAWLYQDEAHATHARQIAAALRDDFETQTTLDVNIRMPAVLINHVLAWDLLRATPWFPQDESDALRGKLLRIADVFFEDYVQDDVHRRLLLEPAQNNHPIRTAAALGAVALAFPDAPRSDEQASWAFSELDYLWGPDGRYVQPDGGVSEGPFYYGFALAPTLALLSMVQNARSAGRAFPPLHRSCLNRSDTDPWTGHGCVEGEPFVFANPLRTDWFGATVDWSIALRLPWGSRPPLGDAYFNPLNGAALLAGDAPLRRWDWEQNRDRPLATTHAQDLTPWHLVHAPDVPPQEPPWTSAFLPDAGNAVFRSSWDQDAVWGLLVAESGAARKTLHDHVDGTSLTVAAYGEYLLIDPGYYKPVDFDNARTAHSPSHNVVLVDGLSAPDKGLLTEFGDADAALLGSRLGGRVEVAQARQGARDGEALRTVFFVGGRFFVVVDQRQSEREPRTHAWRMHGYGGGDTGGTFDLLEQGARWQRPGAGVEVYVSSPAGPLRYAEPPYEAGFAPSVHEFDLDRHVGHHAVLDASIEAEAPGFLSVLAPYPVEDGQPEQTLLVSSIPVDEGVGWRVTGDGVDAVAVLWEGGALDVAGVGTITTDAGAFVLDAGSGAAVGGSSLSIDGVQVASWAESPGAW